jgi:hypothetical protein
MNQEGKYALHMLKYIISMSAPAPVVCKESLILGCNHFGFAHFFGAIDYSIDGRTLDILSMIQAIGHSGPELCPWLQVTNKKSTLF